MTNEHMPAATGRMNTDRCIFLFVKSPDQGTVKSRLANDVGEAMARELYRNFVLDMLETLSGLSAKAGYALNLCVHPPEALMDIRHWLGGKYDYTAQQGKDLGERMKNAFLSSFAKGYRQVLLLGSDTPDLPGGIITQGFNLLQEKGAVIGPAHDGGYYLIGFHSGAFLPGVFEKIPWSTHTVFAETMEIFQNNQCPVSVLPPWRDIDNLADLKDLWERHQTSYFANSRTMQCFRLLDKPAPCPNAETS